MKGRGAGALILTAVVLGSGGLRAETDAKPMAAAEPMALPPLSRTFDKFPSEANGCWELARHYDAGVGTVKDPYLAAYWARVAAQRGAAAAASWLAASASRGDAFAQLQYSVLLNKGVGAPRDTDAANVWAKRAMPSLEASAKQSKDAASEYDPPALGAWGLALLNLHVARIHLPEAPEATRTGSGGRRCSAQGTEGARTR